MSVCSIDCGEQVFGLARHSSRDLMAVGTIDGRVQIIAPGAAAEGDQEPAPVASISAHAASCRAVAFGATGDVLYTAGSDGFIAVFDDQGREKTRMQVSDVAVNRILSSGEDLLFTGDDEGGVSCLDMRTGAVSMQWTEHEDYVSSLMMHEESTLLSTSGDSTLCTYDLRSHRVLRSEPQEDELLCVEMLRSGCKIVCGALNGTMLLFSSGSHEDCSDRFPGHPAAVNCMLKVDESTVLTGCEDGLVRVLSILPNKVLGVIGDHDGFPVEGFDYSPDRRYLASFSHDSLIRLWDVSMFIGDEAEDEDQSSEAEERNRADEMDNDSHSDDDSESESGSGDVDRMDSGSDSEDDGGHPPLRSLPTTAEKFFADM